MLACYTHTMGAEGTGSKSGAAGAATVSHEPQTAEDVVRSATRYYQGQERTGRQETLAGLSLALGFCRASDLLDAAERGTDADGQPRDAGMVRELRRALLALQEAAETATYDKDRYRGGMFLLRSVFDWSDKGDDTAGAMLGEAPTILL